MSRVDRLLTTLTVLGMLAVGAAVLACDDCKAAFVRACVGGQAGVKPAASGTVTSNVL